MQLQINCHTICPNQLRLFIDVFGLTFKASDMESNSFLSQIFDVNHILRRLIWQEFFLRELVFVDRQIPTK